MRYAVILMTITAEIHCIVLLPSCRERTRLNDTIFFSGCWCWHSADSKGALKIAGLYRRGYYVREVVLLRCE